LSVYLDTSVFIPLFITEDHSVRVKKWVSATREQLYYSHLVAGEFNSAVSRYVRMGEIDPRHAEEIRNDAAQWLQREMRCASIDDADIEAASRAVANPQPKLLMPDAIHLVICARLDLTLATFDQDLLTIAEREGVPAITPA
jgi:uncharacterized protein